MEGIGFTSLKECVSELEALCCSYLDSNEIESISLDEPIGPFNELYFRKVVAWCYGLLFESGVFFRFSKDLVRSTNPEAFRKVQDTLDIVRASRTVHGHNLKLHRAHDRDTRNRYTIWIVSEGGTPTDWQKCVVALVRAVCNTLNCVKAVWVEKCGEEWSRAEIVKAYYEDKRIYWEAHEFDRFTISAATKVGLRDFDYVKFRGSNGRLERWRRLVCCFETRQSAEDAVERAILRELTDIFGRSA